MLNLDPAKLLIIAVVAVLLLGPDRLPQVARQCGDAWRAVGQFRQRMEAEVRSNLPDLPSTGELARLARSPVALLDHLVGTASAGSEPGPTAEEKPEIVVPVPEPVVGNPGPAHPVVVAVAGDANLN
jgi:TatA/E family protein of Tat protein translocase